ncbi:MAG: hypothetical protein ACLFRG_18185 [Desulfococcaceae bacterium]
MMFQPLDWKEPSLSNAPRNVEEVVDLLLSDLTLRDRVMMAEMKESNLPQVYQALSAVLKREFGLVTENTSLLRSCIRKARSYDNGLMEDPAMVIIRNLWLRLRRSHALRVVH